ncbi:MAG: hypothetical protein P4M15_07280 [Alphaproteobacteria bacterium]|nr:hypothetical protein [Alphaproteobacteria bacterium]
MGDLVSLSDARIARQRRKQADLFSPGPFIALQSAWLEMIRANVSMVMAICFGARRS